MKNLVNKGTYVLQNFPCCWNCKHSFVRMGLSLLCNNEKEWVSESAVQPVGICEYYESKISQEEKH